MRLLLFITLSCLVSACAAVILPVKVATTAAGTAVDVVTTTADVIVPDGDDATKAK